MPDIFENQLNLSEARKSVGGETPLKLIEQEDDGENVAQGFINGILENLMDAREAGEQLIDAVEDGIRDAGEIQSPSKLAQRLGRWFAQGFGLGMSQENLETRGREVVDSSQGGIVAQIKNAFAQLGTTFPFLVKYKNLLMGIAGLFLGGMGISFIISQLGRFGQQALDTAMAVESLNKSIIVSSRDFASGADNLNFISDAAKNMSIDLMAAKQAYAGLIGAAKNTPLEGQQAERIFNAFAQASANRGVDVQGQERLFTALSQIIGKRKLQAEEVKGQIGDIKGFGDFQGLIAQALGVSTPELGKMMEQGQVGIDVLPKIAAILEAQNATASGTQTALQAQTKYNNSLVEFNTVLGNLLQPLQKLGFNLISGGLDVITQKLGSITKIVVNLAGVALVGLFGQVNVVKLAVAGLGQVLNALIVTFSNLWAAKTAILVQSLKFIAAYALVAGAIAAVTNVIDLSKNQYQELNDDVEKLTASMGRYTAAIKEANAEQAKVEAPSELQLNEGWKLPDNKFGNFLRPLVGGDRLNLDNLVRGKWNGMIDRMDAYNSAASGGTAKPLKGRILTEAERRQADFQVATRDLNFRTNQLLTNSTPATDAAKQITEFDAQIAKIQSKRLELLPSDKKALEASLEEERKINTERDKQLKILTQYQQSLQLAQTTNQKALEELETGYANGEFEPAVYESQKAALLDTQSATADKLEVINNILSTVNKTLSQFQRELRNSNERINNFIERRGKEAQGERTKIITEGIELSKGSSVIELELESASRDELNDYIVELENTIELSQKRLNSGALAEGYKLIQESAATNGLTLDSATVDRLLAEEGRNQAEKDALGEVKALLDNSSKLAGYREQLAQNLQTNRNALIDFNRTISDYFFRINQQIKEAQIEVLRIIEQIVQTQIRNKLQAAISPNAESFVNGLISSTQSMLDQAASYAEKVLGQRGARIQFAGQKRTLEMELQDFARNVSGASEALAEFERRLRGGEGQGNALPVQDSNSFATKTKEVAGRLGIDPHALMTIMLFESAGTLDPKIQGTNVPGQGRGRGLIQFMPATARDLGTSDAALAAMTQLEQLDWVEKYFAQFKGNFGAGKLENLYAAVLAGDPRKVDASDGYTTARKAAPRMMSQYGARATSLLQSAFDVSNTASSSNFPVTSNKILAVPSVPNSSSTFELPPPPDMEQATAETRFAISKQEQILDLQDGLIQNQEKEGLEINLENTFKSERRRVENEIKQRQFAMDDAIFAQLDLLSQYDYQTADTQGAKNIRDTNKAFSDRYSEILRQVQFYEDEISSLEQIIALTPILIAQADTEEEKKIIYEQEANAKMLLPVYQENLGNFLSQEQELTKTADKALGFVRDQNKLKKEQEDIGKRSLILNQRDAILQARGTLEEQRQSKIALEDARVEDEINKLRQSTPEGYDRNEGILNILRQSKINKENIDYDALTGELDLEKRLLDYQSGIGEKKAGFLSRIGFNFGASKIQRDNAIAQENNRFKKELIELQKLYQNQPELLEKFTRAATELNAVNLEAINQQFKSLGQTVEDSFVTSTQGFFNQFTTNLFDGKTERDRAQLEERLRYAEEVVGLENQYRDTPGKLAHLKNRARELNEEKLDKIRGEFNLFSRVIDLARGALLEFVKQLAQLAAQQAAAKFISSILNIFAKSGSPAIKAGNDYGSGAGTFTASEGITVGKDETPGETPGARYVRDEVDNYRSGGGIKKRKISDRLTQMLRQNAPGVAQAWNAEGEGAQLGVFHTGEELLSRKTGEAGRYQALKRMYGFNPLDKIGVFKDGGTVGDNILATIPRVSSPRLDFSGLSEVSRGQGNALPVQRSEVRRAVTINTTVVTPNADSFRLNQDQMNQDLVERMRRGI